jgi:hypothetical protein
VNGQIRDRGNRAAGEIQPDYSDMINLPHHVSTRHPQMSRAARAAQFGSFEPLRDYRDVLAEERRLTDERPVLSEEEQKKLNEMVAKLASDTAQPSAKHPKIRMTVFVQDEKKEGGRIEEITGALRTVNLELRYLVLEDGRKVPFRDLLRLTAERPELPF